jgi:hypothetical protein
MSEPGNGHPTGLSAFVERQSDAGHFMWVEREDRFWNAFAPGPTFDPDR